MGAIIWEGEEKFLGTGLKFMDLLLTCAAFWLAFVLRFGSWDLLGHTHGENYLLIGALTLVCCYFAFDFCHPYPVDRRCDINQMVGPLLKGVIFGMVGAVVLFYLLKFRDVSRLLLFIFFLLEILLLLIGRLLVIGFVRWRGNSRFAQNILIIGSKERTKDLIHFIKANDDPSYHLLGCLDPDPERRHMEVVPGVSVIGNMDDYQQILLESPVDEVIFAMPLQLIDNVQEKIRLTEKVGVNVRIMPDWQLQKLMFQPEVASVYIERFSGMPTLVLSSTPHKVLELFVKGVMDKVASAVGLVVLSPLLALVALLIKVTSRGSIFFRQERCGLNGRIFTMYKFRTMVENAEALKPGLAASNEVDGPVFKIKDDPRITPLGHFLRRTSIDELPQLINAVRGEMSLVGPRPPLPSEVVQYQSWQRRRLSMKPGLTCIWQVSGRNRVGFDSWMKMDLEYIDGWSLSLDMKLLCKTLVAVMSGSGH